MTEIQYKKEKTRILTSFLIQSFIISTICLIYTGLFGWNVYLPETLTEAALDVTCIIALIICIVRTNKHLKAIRKLRGQ